MKDYAYVLLFDKKDKEKLSNYAAEIRATHDHELVDNFNKLAEARWNDHKDTIEGIEPMKVAKATDLVTTAGINFMVQQFQFQGAGAHVPWRYMGYGRLVPPAPSLPLNVPAATDTTLQNEASIAPDPRVDMTTEGWIEYTSTSLRFGGVFGEGRADVGVAEAAIFTALTGGTMLNRNVFDNADIWHKQFVSVFVISSVIEFVPVVS